MAPLMLAHRQIQADTAGYTGRSPAPVTAAPQTAEMVWPHAGGDLGAVFAGGAHPESAPMVVRALVDTSLDAPPNIVRGAHGAIARAMSPALAGPAGRAATLRQRLGI